MFLENNGTMITCENVNHLDPLTNHYCPAIQHLSLWRGYLSLFNLSADAMASHQE
jgi:hypothetical protein